MNLPLNIDFQQIALHLLNFVILAGGLYLLLYNPVKKFMSARSERFAEMETNAKETAEQAEALKEEYKKLLEAADEEISKKKAEAAKKAAEIREEELEKAHIQAEKIIDTARIEARHEHDKIIAEATASITEIATAATEKLLKDSGSDAFDKFLDSAERGQNDAG